MIDKKLTVYGFSQFVIHQLICKLTIVILFLIQCEMKSKRQRLNKLRINHIVFIDTGELIRFDRNELHSRTRQNNSMPPNLSILSLAAPSFPLQSPLSVLHPRTLSALPSQDVLIMPQNEHSENLSPAPSSPTSISLTLPQDSLLDINTSYPEEFSFDQMTDDQENSFNSSTDDDFPFDI